MTPEEFFKKLAKEDKDKFIDLKNQKPTDFISTGSWILDSLIGDGSMTGKPGGLPRGHIVEVFGDESSGKTTMALSAIKKAQEAGGFALLLDYEQTFHAKYAEKIGVDTSVNKLLVASPSHFQHGARLIYDAITEMRPPLIVVDSVSGMIPKQVLEGEIDEGGAIGLQARLMSQFLQWITKFLKDSNTCLLFINQLRNVIKKSKYDPGPDQETSSGLAIRFYSSVRIKLQKSAVEKIDVISKLTGKKGQEPINVTVKATVVKNKIDKPWFTAPLYIRFAEGFDNILSVIELAINTGVIKKAGAFYAFTHNDGTLQAQGKEQLRKMLDEQPKIFEQLRANLVLREDKKVKEEYKDEKQDALDDILDSAAESYIDKRKTKKTKEAENKPEVDEEKE